MAQPLVQSRLSPEEYLAFERASEQKHEYANGEVFAMAGASREHSLLTTNLVRELSVALIERPCEVHASDMRVKIPSSRRYLYPDVSIVCSEPAFEDAELDTLLNPKVVIEVLSDSTEAYDRGEKFAYYRSVASIAEYVLVAQSRVRIEHFERQPSGTWLLTIFGAGEDLAIRSLSVRVQVDRIYLRVPFPASAAD